MFFLVLVIEEMKKMSSNNVRVPFADIQSGLGQGFMLDS
jgi:hypothetical protein